MGTAAIKNLKAILFYAGAVALCVPPLFVFAWMIMTGLKTGVQNVTQSATYAVKCEVKPRQRAIIKAGGLLNYTRQAAKA